MNNGSGKKRAKRRRIESPFGRILKAILAEQGITYRQAASFAGVPNSVLHAWITGGAPQDLLAVARLAKVLRCDFQMLLTGVPSEGSVPSNSLAQIFEINPDEELSGIFLVEAKRLKWRVQRS